MIEKEHRKSLITAGIVGGVIVICIIGLLIHCARKAMCCLNKEGARVEAELAGLDAEFDEEESVRKSKKTKKKMRSNSFKGRSADLTAAEMYNPDESNNSMEGSEPKVVRQ